MLLSLPGQIYRAENDGTKGRICGDDEQKITKTTQESARLTQSNASQTILLFLLLIFHGAIYYCAVYNTTQTISLVDYIYQILKSVLNKYGTL